MSRKAAKHVLSYVDGGAKVEEFSKKGVFTFAVLASWREESGLRFWEPDYCGGEPAPKKATRRRAKYWG